MIGALPSSRAVTNFSSRQGNEKKFWDLNNLLGKKWEGVEMEI